MGITKTNLFNEAQNEIASYGKAFSHPARVAIIQHLLNVKACINGDLVEELGLAQATISQHLRELKDIGVIHGNIEGSRVNYCINSQRWKEITSRFNEIFNQYQCSDEDDCC